MTPSEFDETLRVEAIRAAAGANVSPQAVTLAYRFDPDEPGWFWDCQIEIELGRPSGYGADPGDAVDDALCAVVRYRKRCSER